MKSGAEFSQDPGRAYRYALWRIWDESKPQLLFIGLNPSTADGTTDDNTIVACTRHSKAWGYGGFNIGNLFAFADTYQKSIWEVKDPIGPENDAWLEKLANSSGKIIAAWGNEGWRLNRSEVVRKMLGELFCLERNKSGEPHHPLYIKTPAQPIRYTRDKLKHCGIDIRNGKP